MTKSGTKVGFIGLGIMGTPMALNLIKAGHQLFVSSRSKIPAELAEQGATVCTSATEVAKRADIIITMVPDTPHVEDVLFGETGVAKGLSAGKTVVDMSSISPADQRAGLRLPGRTGQRWRGGRQGRQPDHHGRRAGGGFRARQAAV